MKVTGLTRESSKATLPNGAIHLKINFSDESLRQAFQGQDAVISTISSISVGGDLRNQNSIIAAAVASKVKVFVPSEYGIDTSSRAAAEVVPFVGDKIATVDYIKAKGDSIAWIALITGSMFD